MSSDILGTVQMNYIVMLVMLGLVIGSHFGTICINIISFFRKTTKNDLMMNQIILYHCISSMIIAFGIFFIIMSGVITIANQPIDDSETILDKIASSILLFINRLNLFFTEFFIMFLYSSFGALWYFFDKQMYILHKSHNHNYILFLTLITILIFILFYSYFVTNLKLFSSSNLSLNILNTFLPMKYVELMYGNKIKIHDMYRIFTSIIIVLTVIFLIQMYIEVTCFMTDDII